MADRAFQTPKTQQLNLIFLPVDLLGQGTGKAPILGPSDPIGAFLQQPVFVSTGVFTITTVDGYPNVATVLHGYAEGTATDTVDLQEGPPAFQNANGTWTFTFNLYIGGTLTDVPTTDKVHFMPCMMNTGATGQG
jgi:hypothetical protein